MKIQTQARLLVAGIVAVPLLVILTSVIYRQFFDKTDVSGLPVYEDVSTLLQENFSAREWDSLMHSIARFQNLGDVAIFRNDFFVLYSELPGFSPNAFATWESILPLLENQRFIFSSIGMEENQGYILIEFKKHSIKSRLIPFFIPVIIGMILLGILILFAICMSIVIARTIANSVKVLENATRRIAEGELNLKVDVKGSNEIISLTNSLNKMRDALKEDELSRSRFIMGITHDLKTPLALIKGYAEAIEDGIADDPASRTEAAGIITSKADQLEGMINDLINFVRMETGEWRTQLEHISLSAFLQNLAKALNNDVELLNHTLTYDVVLPENISIPMDEKLALRAFENLIHNAVRYTPHESIIHLTAVCLENAVEIKISDNGPGLDKEDLPHVFEMFYRGSSSRREQGMGLGLAVVKWVVDYHGWSISALSEQGKGACFIITIPLPEIITVRSNA
jgi:signal transduction histidine kinase